MVVDYEAVVLALKAYIVTRNSHGKRDLLARLVELEVEYALPEGEEGIDPTPLRLARSEPADERPQGAHHG